MAKLLYSLAILLFSSVALGFIPNCNIPEQGSTLQVIHVNSPCSPFRSKTQLSWEDSVLQMQSEDKERLIYLSSLVAGRSIVPVASGRQVTQNPTYILRAKIGTPPQILLMAMDTSSDAAWVPCSGCVGCPTTAFYTAKSTSFKNLSCGAAQCKQV